MCTDTSVDLLRRWRRQVGAQRRAPRGLGALGYDVDGRRSGDLVELQRLTLVVLYDLPRRSGELAIRIGTFAASRMPHGVQWGGPDNLRSRKDLALQPAPQGQGLRLDLFHAAAVDQALRLNGRIDAALRYQPGAARAALRLPRLWAGFTGKTAAELRGDGPEFEALAARFDLPPDVLLAKFRREQRGQTLYPLDWVSHAIDQAATVWAELQGFPQRQVFGVARPTADLVGFAGAATFDFTDPPLRRRAAPTAPLAAAG